MHAGNEQTFDVIEQALFTIALDSNRPATYEQAGQLLFCGNTANRWYDTLTQLIVFESGHCGVSGEHSPMDGPVTGRLIEHALQWASNADTSTSSDSASLAASKPKALPWTVSEQVQQLLESAKRDAHAIETSTEIRYLEFSDYGANWVKQVAKASPDSYFQLALQLAFRKLHGTVRSPSCHSFKHHSLSLTHHVIRNERSCL